MEDAGKRTAEAAGGNGHASLGAAGRGSRAAGASVEPGARAHANASSSPGSKPAPVATTGDAAKRRRAIVDAAVDIAARQGLAAVSARGVARAAGVSVGYLYKLFPTKSDIVVAAATRFFERAFFDDFCHIEPGETYVIYCRRLYARAAAVLDDFRATWLVDREDLPQADRLAAHVRESQTLAHAKRGLVAVLEHDERVRWDRLPAGVDAEAVVEFTARSAMSALQAGEPDCPLLFYLLEQGLYGSGAGDAAPAAPSGAGADVPAAATGGAGPRV